MRSNCSSSGVGTPQRLLLLQLARLVPEKSAGRWALKGQLHKRARVSRLLALERERPECLGRQRRTAFIRVPMKLLMDKPVQLQFGKSIAQSTREAIASKTLERPVQLIRE